jgi:hypothetical protein
MYHFLHFTHKIQSYTKESTWYIAFVIQMSSKNCEFNCIDQEIKLKNLIIFYKIMKLRGGIKWDSNRENSLSPIENTIFCSHLHISNIPCSPHTQLRTPSCQKVTGTTSSAFTKLLLGLHPGDYLPSNAGSRGKCLLCT